MSDQQTPISEEEIHAYVDGTLSDERREEVERAIELNPALAARVSDYFSLNNMFHERYDRVLNEPVPARLRMPEKRRWLSAANWPQFAGMAAALVLGIGIGVGTNMGKDVAAPGASAPSATSNTRPVSADASEVFAQKAALAHVVYMPTVSRPAQIGEDHEQDFVQYLANKLGTEVHPPMLTKSGFELAGGRILPGDDGPVAQFMYHNANGERVTLCISHRKVNANTTAFKLYQEGPVNVFYWVDGDFGYAVSGGIDRKVMLQIAHDVYAQLTGATPG
ncbi:anti-sigma factor family protein [Paraburkholderia hospita]|jgi:anti-sigma factor RsiW|uniref:Transcriptional regulator n=1 Tax=Paraburkholderia hospita TaxID=169430 RepID=A0AAN1J5N5_9BURK|nr:anti-sigma factor [Paraburkholderia hospita]SKC66101.1 Transmembrane transcriptional regulator (anti-sigma factor RsiW) [Burkholderia sp. CF099]AUT66917.1 transcriptional regulator [Paraburkholderia hospita]OUL76296.1 transcriptional regulator [Paraburkholderia hospita]SEH39619.1 Transmembrane transcriptional regulator (anti-sigma factor RsiW) [Paraburkholderia hospita]SKC51242.1 Transmembrane transcriptional regulator (anti-sigma factor RsiW) [Paraburkholderia hospita]